MRASDEPRRCQLPGCDRPAGRRSKTGACCGAHAIRLAMRRDAREQGYVLLVDIARRLDTDRRVFERRCERRELDSKRVDSKHVRGVIWIRRDSLAAYLWSRRGASPRSATAG